MTRPDLEAIRERTLSDLIVRLDKQAVRGKDGVLEYSLDRAIARLDELEAQLAEARRATLEEAAKAVCRSCRRGDKPLHVGEFEFIHRHPDGVTEWTCDAQDIHIAAIAPAAEKEGGR